MASLTDLFSLPFLMFLGILVLVVALVVVYFESKFREQNHKIAETFNAGYAEFPNGYIRYKIGKNGQLVFDVIKDPVNVYFPNPDNPYDRLIESQNPNNYYVIRESGKDSGF